MRLIARLQAQDNSISDICQFYYKNQLYGKSVARVITPPRHDALVALFQLGNKVVQSNMTRVHTFDQVDHMLCDIVGMIADAFQ